MFRGKALTYFGLALGLVAVRFSLGDIAWSSNRELHTLMEFATTILALIIAGAALARYYARKNKMFLLIGCGFLGTSFLDGNHTLITSQWFSQFQFSEPSYYFTWSWNATRIYLGTFLFLSYWIQRKEKLPEEVDFTEKKSVFSALVLLSLGIVAYLYLARLPQVYYSDLFLTRPGDLIAGFFFLLALAGYLRKGVWKHDVFEHWLVVSLILSLASQTIFMSCSMALCDIMFDLAHFAKIASYVCVLTGLLVSMYEIFLQAEERKIELLRSNESLQNEYKQRNKAEDEVHLLNVDLERRVSERTAQLNSALLDLQVQETRIRTILETAGEGVISFDKGTIIESLNPAAQKIFGYEERELIGKSISLLVEKSYRMYYFRHLKNYLGQGRKTLPATPREVLGLHKDGSTFPIEVTVDAAQIDNDYLFIGTVRDISDRKKAESALAETLNRLELAMRGSNLGLWDMNLATGETQYDERWASMLGYDLSEIEQSQDTFYSLIHPDDMLRARDDWFKRQRNEAAFYTSEFRLKSKDGRWKWIYTHGQLSDFDESGQPRRATGIHQDITERKEIEAVIRKSEERYRSLFENSPIPHWEQDYSAAKDFIDGLRSKGVKDFRKYFREHPKAVVLCGSLIKILDVNQATLKLFKGKNKSEIQGGLYKMATTDSFAVVRKVLVALCEGQTHFESQFKGKDLEGHPYHVILNLFLIPGYEDTWSRASVSTVDVLRLREAEDQATHLGRVLEDSLNEIYIYEPKSLKFLQVNRGARENLQYTTEELAELTPLDFKPDFTADSLDYLIRPLLSGEEEVVNFSTLHQRKDGSTYPVECHLQMSTIDNKPVVVAITEDVSEREKAERSLHENEARLSTILNTVADGIIVFDKNKRIETFNPAAEKMFGYSFEEISKLDASILAVEEYRKKYEDSMLMYLTEGVKQFAGRTQEVEGLRKDGSTFPMEFLASVAETQEGPKWIVLIRDITERKRIEQELENHRQNLEYTVESRTAELRMSMEKLMDTNLRLEEANKHRSRFISSMSHELRTPLSAILGFADLYKKNYGITADEKQNSYINNITKAGRHLLNLINGLLDLAKIDSGKMEIELDVFNPGDFVEEILSIMISQFNEKNLTVETFVDPYLTEVCGDRKKCMQIMLNLLSNAFKFTTVGGRIDIYVIQDSEGGAKVEVSDTGVGIEPGEIDKIFSEYYQIAKASTSANEGMGIGLALTKRLVELQGGAIGVESKPNVGSSFWFTLPKVSVLDRLQQKIETEDYGEKLTPTGCRILLAEDSAIIRTMLLDMLNQHGHHIAIAQNGEEAVEQAKKIKPDLIFMDIRMPVMDGLEATRRIREIPEIANTPIIALTASTGSSSEVLQSEAGCSAHMAKPVIAEEMFDMLKRFLGASKNDEGKDEK